MDFEARAARNEEIFRHINERIEAGAELHQVQGEVTFHCECGNASCLAELRLTTEAYAAIYADPDRFAVVPGHELPEVERVVARRDRYLIVEKVGEAARLVEDDRGRDSG